MGKAFPLLSYTGVSNFWRLPFSGFLFKGKRLGNSASWAVQNRPRPWPMGATTTPPLPIRWQTCRRQRESLVGHPKEKNHPRNSEIYMYIYIYIGCFQCFPVELPANPTLRTLWPCWFQSLSCPRPPASWIPPRSCGSCGPSPSG